MAAHANVMITVEPAKTQKVADRLRSIVQVQAREVLGVYDFILEVEADTDEDLTAVLRHKIRPISGITSTVTCLWF